MKKKWGPTRMALLERVYSLYRHALDPFESECRQKCSVCCTCNVTLTSLEAGFIIAALTPQQKKDIQTRIEYHFPPKRYQPDMTTNRFARFCCEGKDIPEEENDPSWGNCPLLVDNLCSIYDVRPFGCRALMSTVPCGENGYARVPPIVLTINNLFLQYIEHLDQEGFSGNLSDMLPFFLSDVVRMPGGRGFAANEKIAILMVPPEHRERIRPVMEALYQIR
jgi:Fe-S-cluster containining protein